jgi:SAM-dependent methyltransferase
MSRTMRTATRLPEPGWVPRLSEIAICVNCGVGLEGRETCLGCGFSYPSSSGILTAAWILRGRNRIAEAFYDGPGWAKFRRWERLFLKVQGGEARARRQILRHLAAPPFARVLEVGIGDGANLPLLPKDWTAYGVDIARKPLEECIQRVPEMADRLARAEAEALPFSDGTFDACWTLGGFNYFRDHDAALREMKRVTRPGGTLIVADEMPNMYRYGIGHLVGFPSIDAFWLKGLGLDPEFIQMVFEHQFDPDSVVLENWPGAVRFPIWGGLGYCFVDSDGPPRTDSDSSHEIPHWRSPA